VRGEALVLEASRRPDGTMAVRERVGGQVAASAAPAQGFAGLARFLDVRVLDAAGAVVLEQRRTVCPNVGMQHRLGADGALGEPRPSPFPSDCGYPLSRAVVWGIARERAVRLASTGWTSPAPARRLAPGRYRLELTVDPDGLLADADRANNRLSLALRVRGARGEARTPDEAQPKPSVAPEADHPHAASAGAGRAALPDLVPLPPASVSIERGRLAFDAVVANVGDGALIVRGDGVRDDRDGHGHWHYDGLARYRLRDADGDVVARSGKVGFCFLDTTAVDLRLERPAWTLAPPVGGNFCLGRRPYERLDPGWGDLYVQSLPGQSLDVRRLPDGAYSLEVAVNADGRLLESDLTNDVVARTLVLGHRGAGRTVTMPPFGGVDTVAELGPVWGGV